MRLHRPLPLLLAAALSAATTAHAADVYRWVDDKGRVQFSDTVPEKYKGVAKRVDATPKNVIPGAPRRGEETPREGPREGPARSGGGRPVPAASAPAAAASAPPQAQAAPAGDEAECEQLWRRYMGSQSCFAPFRQANGSIKVEAYDVCGQPVANPEPRCGPLKAAP